ncbi:hypothetical protein, partial [uncultured Campylobacter sp.]|uniref:hypothetical protein n=1 Tax=uncultured Campylobacter sp. TaxID=218934 RepID=UPI002602308C
AVFLADHLAFKFCRLNFAQNRDRTPSTDLQAACRAVALAPPPTACERLAARVPMPMYANTWRLG